MFNKNIILNTFLILFLLFAISGTQTTLWPVLSTTLQPQLWLAITVYIVLYRSKYVCYMVLFLISLVIKGMTLFPLSYILLSVFIVYLCLQQLKHKTFWKGPSYFLLCTFIGTLIFGLSLKLIELTSSNSLSFNLVSWVISAALNIPAGLLVYYIIRKIDELTSIELPAETGYNQYG